MELTILMKIIGLIIFPIVIGIILFYPRKIRLSIIKEKDKVFIKIPNFIQLNEKSGIGRMLRSILATPFDLKYYTVTIKDISSYKGSKGNLGYYLYLDKEKLDFLKAGSKIKTTLLTDRPHKIILKTEVKVERGDAPPGSKVTFTIDFDTYARPNILDITAKIFIILIVWNGLFFLGKQIYEFIIR